MPNEKTISTPQDPLPEASVSSPIVDKPLLNTEEQKESPQESSTIHPNQADVPQINIPEVKSEKNLTPMVSIDINQMLEDIKRKEKEQNDARTNLSIEQIESIWLAYKNTTESPSVQAALGNCLLNLDDIYLTITVPNITSQNIIKSEKDLLEKIRQETGSPIKYTYVVDVLKFPDQETEKPDFLLSDREKFSVLYAQNEAFKKLVDKFNLKLDNE